MRSVAKKRHSFSRAVSMWGSEKPRILGSFARSKHKSTEELARIFCKETLYKNSAWPCASACCFLRHHQTNNSPPQSSTLLWDGGYAGKAGSLFTKVMGTPLCLFLVEEPLKAIKGEPLRKVFPSTKVRVIWSYCLCEWFHPLALVPQPFLIVRCAVRLQCLVCSYLRFLVGLFSWTHLFVPADDR